MNNFKERQKLEEKILEKIQTISSFRRFGGKVFGEPVDLHVPMQSDLSAIVYDFCNSVWNMALMEKAYTVLGEWKLPKYVKIRIRDHRDEETDAEIIPIRCWWGFTPDFPERAGWVLTAERKENGGSVQEDIPLHCVVLVEGVGCNLSIGRWDLICSHYKE